MDFQILRRDPLQVALLRHKGPYEELPPYFERIWRWAQSQGLPTSPLIGLYWDDPQTTTLGRLRSAACVEVPAGFAFDRAGDSPELDTIAGGEYAVTRYVGPYPELSRVTADLFKRIEGPFGRRRVSGAPAIEIYRNDPEDVLPSELVTDILLPLE